MALAATNLHAERQRPCRLAPLILMTDPERLPNPVAAASKLPKGAAVIYRHFGAKNREAISRTLRQVTFSRGQQLLIGNDPELALETGADGVHFKRTADLALPAQWRKRCPDWIITMAGLKEDGAYNGEMTALDAVFISSIFPSQSPSAGTPIGLQGLQDACRELPVPVIALGGINAKNASSLSGSGAYGLAGISGI